MNNTATLYSKLLGLETPWAVKKVSLSENHQCIMVEVDYVPKVKWTDPKDPYARLNFKNSILHSWRHLDTCNLETVIVAELPNIDYSNGQTEVLEVPWADRYSRLSRPMHELVLKLLEVCPSPAQVYEVTRIRSGSNGFELAST